MKTFKNKFIAYQRTLSLSLLSLPVEGGFFLLGINFLPKKSLNAVRQMDEPS